MTAWGRMDHCRAAILIRAAVGVVFLSEGIQKLVYAEAQGAGRFATIGIPVPSVAGPAVGVVEMVCGLLVLVGFLTRLAALPVSVIMVGALITTKVPILLGQGFWLFAHTFAPKVGFWAFLHESRTDLSMLCGASYLALAGGGPWSLDAAWAWRRTRERQA